MSRLMVTALLCIGTQCMGMECPQLTLTLEEVDHLAPVEVQSWATTVVQCIEKRKSSQLRTLLNQSPQLRSQYPLNNKIIEEIKQHRNEQQYALQSNCGSKKIWNKFRAIAIDLGLPLAAFGVGLAEGIIAQEPVIIALSSIYLVLSLESALKQTYTHWTMKEYEGKVEEFDVWLQLMEGMQRLEKKGEQDLIPHNNNEIK